MQVICLISENEGQDRKTPVAGAKKAAIFAMAPSPENSLSLAMSERIVCEERKPQHDRGMYNHWVNEFAAHLATFVRTFVVITVLSAIL
ncbi:hypothetical protein CEV33_3917 [Brucella grignonensis]|uniref:Uncharacterized protein n=1 Tax=Brucella grignonensis TaxID=94627 RepID=A0A256FRU0_9HYPH|nr:hypothetical protein CEV33_3917 [Brucella grignonensis]